MIESSIKTVLFVCSSNKHRSKTAEDIFSVLYTTLTITSAGTNEKLCKKHRGAFLTEALLRAADLILVMEDHHQNLINKATDNKYATKIDVLYIPDEYQYGQTELVDLLKKRTEHLLEGL